MLDRYSNVLLKHDWEEYLMIFILDAFTLRFHDFQYYFWNLIKFLHSGRETVGKEEERWKAKAQLVAPRRIISFIEVLKNIPWKDQEFNLACVLKELDQISRFIFTIWNALSLIRLYCNHQIYQLYAVLFWICLNSA